jgi:hypothetical protein
MEAEFRKISKTREELYEECCDLHLPVNRNDNIKVLEAALKAAYDECDSKRELSIEEEFPDDPIYIGKRPRFKLLIGKILSFL